MPDYYSIIKSLKAGKPTKIHAMKIAQLKHLLALLRA
jgi:hypothetical protein